MRSLLLVAALFLSCSSVLSSTCNAPASCPTSPAQVPMPWYSLTFDSPPSTAVNYGYNSTDNDGCGHTGLAVTGIGGGTSAGTATSYIDLVNSTSAQGVSGQSLPTIGSSTVGGSLTNATRGWTFEVTFKPLVQTTWAKVYCIGNGAGVADIILGWNNGNLEIDFTLDTANGQNGARTQSSSGNAVPIPNPNVVLNTWYHIVVVIQQVDAAGQFANWFIYVNGVLTNQSATTQFMVPDSARPNSYLGRSCYASDQLMQMELDTFRIYNQTVNADQVTSLYAQQMGGCNITMTSNPVITSTFPLGYQVNTTSTPNALWGLGFVQNPTSAVGAGVTPSYQWELYDQADAACGLNNTHYGLLVLDGGPPVSEPYSDPSFVNLTALSGPNAITGNGGLSSPNLPILGGGSYSTGTTAAGTAGISFEITFKPALQETWAKLFDFGQVRNATNTGLCNQDIVFGWYTNSLQYMNFEVCDGTGLGGVRDNGLSTAQFGPFLAGYWYHVVITLQLLSNGQSNWYIYQNGALVSVTSNVQYPQYAVRQLSNLGKSNWNDAQWSGWIDTFNIYAYALNPAQVQNLSNIALGPTLASACTFTPSTTSVIPASAIYYDLSFPGNPNVPGQVYQWLAYDPSDSAFNQTIHRGLVNISGNATGNAYNGVYINMSASTGPYSASTKTLGDIGGIGSGSITDSTVGWSFEITFKPTQQLTWAKVFDLGDANGGTWETFFGWHNTDSFYNFGVEFSNQQDYSGNNAQVDDLTPATPTIALNTWYHVVIVTQYNYLLSETTEGSVTFDSGIDYAYYRVYVNGVLTANSTASQFPARAQRIDSLLGKSNYGDSYWQGLIDNFRVYSIALNPNQVQTLYTASQQPPPAAVSSSSSSSSSSGGAMSGSSSSASMSAMMSSSSMSSSGAAAVTSLSTVSAPTAPLQSSSMSSSASMSTTSSSSMSPAGSVTSSSTTTPSQGMTSYSSAVNSVTSATSATSVYAPTIANGAAQSASVVMTIAAAVVALLALLL